MGFSFIPWGNNRHDGCTRVASLDGALVSLQWPREPGNPAPSLGALASIRGGKNGIFKCIRRRFISRRSLSVDWSTRPNLHTACPASHRRIIRSVYRPRGWIVLGLMCPLSVTRTIRPFLSTLTPAPGPLPKDFIREAGCITDCAIAGQW